MFDQKAIFFFKGSGVFSPIGSNLSVVSSSQSHHSAGVAVPPNSPKTLAVTTAVTSPSPLKNVRSSATRSLTELGTAEDRSHDSIPKSYSDTKLITKPPSDASISGGLAPSTARFQSVVEHSSVISHGTDISGENRQPFSGFLSSTEGTRSPQVSLQLSQLTF